MSRLRSLARYPALQNLLLLAASLAVCLVILEVAVRLLQRGGTVYPLVYYNTEDPDVTLWCYDEHARTVPDWDLREEAPYRSISYRSTEGNRAALRGLPFTEVPLAIEVRRNAEGFRERPFEDLQEHGELVLVVGDSFCFGQGVRAEDRFTELLEGRLRALQPERDLAVVNLCRASADIEQIHAYLIENLQRFPRARRVLYVYNLNDPVRDEPLQQQQRYINDLMHLREHKIVAFLPPVLRPLGRSALVRFVLTRIHNERVTRETEHWYRQLHADNAGWATTAALIEEMQRHCQDNGVELTLSIFPLLHQLGDYPLREVHERVEQLCAEREIPCIDLLPAFAGAETRSLWVHPTDFHPNHIAHQRVVPLLEAALARPVPRAGVSERP
jgi:lysophospholipase L1-like esterase